MQTNPNINAERISGHLELDPSVSSSPALIIPPGQSVTTAIDGAIWHNGTNLIFSNTTATFILNQNTVAQSNQTLGFYAQSNTTQSSSGTFDARSLSIVGAGILSVGYTNGSLVFSVPAGGGGGDGYNILAAGTQTANTTGTILFANSNGISFGMSDSTQITASYTVPNTAGLISNIAISGGTTSNTYTGITFGDANSISFGLNGGTITAQYQHNNIANMYAVGNTTQNSSTTLDARTLSFNGLGGITVGYSNGSIQLSGPQTVAQTNQTIGLYALGNTTQNSSTTMDARTLSFNAIGSITMGYSNGSIQVSAPNALTSQSNQNVTAGNGGFAFQTLSFSNVNGISFGTSAGSAITASHNGLTTARASNDAIGLNTAQTNVTWTVNSAGLSFNAAGYAGTGTTFNGANISGSITQNSNGLQLSMSVAAPGAAAENNWFNLLGANTLGNTTASGSTIGLSGGRNITLSGTNGSVIEIQGLSFANSNGVTFGTNAGTLTASVAAGGGFTYDGYIPHGWGAESVTGQHGAGTLFIQPMDNVPAFQFNNFVLPVFFSNVSNSSNSATISVSFGIYTRNVSTLSLLTSGSGSYALTASGTVGSYSLHAGIRNMLIGLTTTLAQSNYWMGIWSRTSANAGGQTFNMMLGSQPNSSYSGILGQASNTTNQMYLGYGRYSVSFSTAMPNSVAFTHIQGNSSILQRPPLYHFVYNTI